MLCNMNVSHGAVLDHKRPSCYIVSMMIHPVFGNKFPGLQVCVTKPAEHQSIKLKTSPVLKNQTVKSNNTTACMLIWSQFD